MDDHNTTTEYHGTDTDICRDAQRRSNQTDKQIN